MGTTNKITTHVYGDGWFTAAINGVPLIGDKGGYSRFRSRKDAREAAESRLKANEAPELFPGTQDALRDLGKQK